MGTVTRGQMFVWHLRCWLHLWSKYHIFRRSSQVLAKWLRSERTSAYTILILYQTVVQHWLLELLSFKDNPLVSVFKGTAGHSKELYYIQNGLNQLLLVNYFGWVSKKLELNLLDQIVLSKSFILRIPVESQDSNFAKTQKSWPPFFSSSNVCHKKISFQRLRSHQGLVKDMFL